MQAVIPDASVILKWFFTHEEYAQSALLLQNHYLDGKVQLLIPSFALYEISNVLCLPKTGYTINQTKGTIAKLLKKDIPIKSFGIRLLNLTIEISYAYHVSVYDACYLALANKYKGKWVTADKKAYKKVRQLNYVVWIEDYFSSVMIEEKGEMITEERLNWYLRAIRNPAFGMGLSREGHWEEIQDIIIEACKHYDVEIPRILQDRAEKRKSST